MVVKRTKKFYRWLRDDDSWLNVIVTLILAVVFIMFIFFPGLGLILQTSLPVVGVLSPSMEHEVAFSTWWATHEAYYESKSISEETFLNYDFPHGFNTGDVIFLKGIKPEDVRAGDVVVYQAGAPYPIIHRVTDVKRSEDGSFLYEIKGDNNRGPNPPAFGVDEHSVNSELLIGKAWFRLPALGWVKKLLVDALAVVGVRLG